MRITITLSKENQDYIKSHKGYGESISSAINNALNISRLIGEQNKKFDILLQKIDHKKPDEELNFIDDFLKGFGKNNFIDIKYMQNLREKVELFTDLGLKSENDFIDK